MAISPKGSVDDARAINESLVTGTSAFNTTFLTGGSAFQDIPRTALFNPTTFATFFEALEPVPVREVDRVVGQSAAAGTLLVPGTKVNLITASVADIPVNIFEAPHVSLATKTVKDVLDVVDNDAAVRQTFARYSNPADVPPAEKQAVIAKFNLTINDAQANTSFEAAFKTIRGALEFE